jgi:ATP-binding cassette subfamily F protein uup
MRVKELSGGEQSRVLLAKILRRGGNFLILDEPTNDLDLQTMRVLEEAILSFKGCVLVVSHDRYFLDRVCDRILAFEGQGRAKIIGLQKGRQIFVGEVGVNSHVTHRLREVGPAVKSPAQRR